MLPFKLLCGGGTNILPTITGNNLISTVKWEFNRLQVVLQDQNSKYCLSWLSATDSNSTNWHLFMRKVKRYNIMSRIFPTHFQAKWNEVLKWGVADANYTLQATAKMGDLWAGGAGILNISSVLVVKARFLSYLRHTTGILKGSVTHPCPHW